MVAATTAFVAVTMKKEGGKQDAVIPHESFCQQTVGISSHEGNIRRELWVHFPPLSSNLPRLNTELRQQPVYLVAA